MRVLYDTILFTLLVGNDDQRNDFLALTYTTSDPFGLQSQISSNLSLYADQRMVCGLCFVIFVIVGLVKDLSDPDYRR